MAELHLQGLSKHFGTVRAVDRIDLTVPDGQFLILVGPSGCGKSTILRMIAGLETPTKGNIFLSGNNVTALSPKDRNVAMVFQNYALYPHMTVRKNLSFGLRMRKVPKTEIRRRVATVAESLGIEALLDRYPSQLSGGQRQRVALGRAIIREPALFLLDEPLSNLDAKLRVSMRAELLRLHSRLRVTTVYVTHDQVEAMTMGDRLVVLKGGFIQQVGSPEEIYREPANAFVARFIGSPAMNLFPSRAVPENGQLQLTVGPHAIRLGAEGYTLASPADVLLGIRPEAFSPAAPHRGRISGEIEIVEMLGKEKILYLKADLAESLLVVAKPDFAGKEGDRLELDFRDEDVHIFEAASGKRM